MEAVGLIGGGPGARKKEPAKAGIPESALTASPTRVGRPQGANHGSENKTTGRGRVPMLFLGRRIGAGGPGMWTAEAVARAWILMSDWCGGPRPAGTMMKRIRMRFKG